MNSLGYKLIAVADINVLKLFKAQGLKINEVYAEHNIAAANDHRQEKHQGLVEKKSMPSSFYDPHTAPKDIEYQEACRNAASYIKQALGDKSFTELYVVADPKMLGHLRQALDDNTKKIINKEIKKDLIKHKLEEIEKAVFA